MGDRIVLPGLGVEPYVKNDPFQDVADRINERVRAVVSDELAELLENGEMPGDASGAGPTIVAAVAAMIHSAGYLTGSFEPNLNGKLLAGIVKDQFNAGRRDFQLYHRPEGSA